jgi:L-fuconolactonase
MVIDAHQHFWHYDPQRHGWITDEMSAIRRDFLPPQFESECVAHGVDASILVQVDQTEAETHFLLELAEQYPRIAAVIGWIDLLSPKLSERLQYFAQFPKLRGFRHIAQGEPDDRFLAQSTFVGGVRLLHEFNFVYEVLIYPRQLPAAIELASRLPEQPFVLDHLAKPFIKSQTLEPWATHMRILAQNKNVFCKLSGMVVEADWPAWKPTDFRPYLDTVFDAFGPERLMFGSDWPVCLLAASYGQVKQLVEAYVNANCPQHKEKIFGGNAARLYQGKADDHGLAA